MTARTALPDWTSFTSSGGGEPVRGRLQSALFWGVDEETGAVLAPPADGVNGPLAGDAPVEMAAPDPNDPADISLTGNVVRIWGGWGYGLLVKTEWDREGDRWLI